MENNERILIPGGELTMRPDSTWEKDGKKLPSPSSLGISFGKKYVSLRIDLVKILYEEISGNDELRKFLKITS